LMAVLNNFDCLVSLVMWAADLAGAKACN
jgi:hypothetical protein